MMQILMTSFIVYGCSGISTTNNISVWYLSRSGKVANIRVSL